MARPKNAETVNRIRETARLLFREKGYHATSYSSLARTSGVNRATVQDYYPKKRLLATEHLARLRSCAEGLAAEEFPKEDELLARQYLLGQIYIASLLSCDESRRFLSDILADRTFMEEEIAADVGWSVGYVRAEDAGSVPEDSLQDMICVMGGVYELMFYSVRTGRPIDVAKRLRPGMEALAVLASMDGRSCARLLSRCALDEDVAARLGREAFRRAFETPWEESAPAGR